MNSHTAGHWWALACVLALVTLFAVVAWGGKACEYLTGRIEQRRELRLARKTPSKGHPTGRVLGPLPVDGAPLTLDEARALSDIEMDAQIQIAEIDYPNRRQP